MHALVTMSASNTGSSVTSLTATFPSAPAAGTVLIAGVTCGQTPTGPAGWTALAEYNFTGTRRTCIYTKVATGAESTAVTVTQTPAGGMRLVIVAVSGVRTVATDADGWITPQTVTGAGVTSAAVSVTPSETPILFVSACGLSTAATTNLDVGPGFAGFDPPLTYTDTLFGFAVGATEKRFLVALTYVTDAAWSWGGTRTYGAVTAGVPVAANTMATLGAGF